MKRVFQEQHQKVSLFCTLLRWGSTVKLKKFIRRENKEVALAEDIEDIAMRRLHPIDLAAVAQATHWKRRRPRRWLINNNKEKGALWNGRDGFDKLFGYGVTARAALRFNRTLQSTGPTWLLESSSKYLNALRQCVYLRPTNENFKK